MIKTYFYLSSILFFVSPLTFADETRAIDDWENVEGVTVQSDERVKRINAYKRKLHEAEKKKLQEGWDQQEGITVQSEERVRHLNELNKIRRENEIRDLKCQICTLRCNIVKDAGQTTCTGPESDSQRQSCMQKGDDFFDACQNNCKTCGPAIQASEP